MVKQFLYDFGPPAWDHPAFWLGETQPFELGRDIGWVGKDFNGRFGASISIDRTMIEVTVTGGEFTVRELQAIVSSLRPVSSIHRERILASSFGELCYQSRHLDLVVTVPMGYWFHRRKPASLLSTVIPVRGIPNHSLKSPVKLPPEYNFRLDTILLFGDVEDPQETEYIFEQAEHPGRYVRILTWDRARVGAPAYPPCRDRQPCFERIISVGAIRIYHAYRDPRYGQHEAVWEKKGRVFMLLVKPTTQSSVEWFEAFLTGVLASYDMA